MKNSKQVQRDWDNRPAFRLVGAQFAYERYLRSFLGDVEMVARWLCVGSALAVFGFATPSIGCAQGDMEGASYISAICQNFGALEKFDVNFEHWLGATPVSEMNSEVGKGKGEVFESETIGRIVLDRKAESAVFAVLQSVDARAQKDVDGKYKVSDADSAKPLNAAATISVFRDGALTQLRGASQRPSVTKMDFHNFHKICRVPLLEFSGMGRFPVILKMDKIQTFRETLPTVFADSTARRLVDGSVQVAIEREAGDSKFETTVSVDTLSLMPVHFALLERKADGSSNVHMNLSTQYDELAGIYLPVRVDFEYREYTPDAKALEAFGYLKIRWNSVNAEIEIPSSTAISEKVNVLEFIGGKEL